MKHRNSIRLAWIILLFYGLGASAQPPKTLSLKEAIDLSIKNSKQLKSSSAKIEQAVAATRQAADRRLPEANASTSYLRLNNPNVNLKVKLNNNNNNGGGTGGTTTTDSKAGKVSQAAYGMFNASLPIYAGSRIRYGIESAKYLEQASKLDADNDKEEVILNTINAYNNLYKSKAAVSLVRESLEQTRQRVKDFANLEKNGLLPRNDLLKAELQSSNTELALLDAESNFKLANVNMNLMLGLPDSTEVVPDSTSLQQTGEVKTIEEYVQLSLQNRKDLAALSLRKKAAATGVKITQGEKYPSIALTGGYVALDVPNLLTVVNAINVGVGIQYSLSTLWKNKAKVAEAKARQTELEANEESLSDAIRLQINKAYQNYLLSTKKIDVYKTAIAQAEENYRIINNKYQNSLATTTELLDADVAQLQARLNYAFAQSDATVAYNELLQTAGLLNY